MAELFDTLKIKGIEFKNRIVVSPMCQYSSEDGFATDWHLVHLGSRAVGGAGLVFTEATSVSPEGRISPADLGIWKDEHIDKLEQIVSFINIQGAIAGIQLAHAGRKASHSEPWKGDLFLQPEEKGWQTVAPSALAFKETDGLPSALDISGIKKVVQDFKSAAERALKAGFKVIELHAAHGYLIHQFFSPLSNNRIDEYGGSFKNRIRLLLEIVDQVRTIMPKDYPLFVRISATDWAEGGWGILDSVKLSAILKTRGVDLIDCSSGGLVPNAKITAGPGYQVGFAEQIRKETGIMTSAVGFITTAEQANDIIATGQADMVLLAREFLRSPYFPLSAAAQLDTDISWPVQYERAKPYKKA